MEISKIFNSLLLEASKKEILINKIGLNEKNAEFLSNRLGPLAVWFFNKYIESYKQYILSTSKLSSKVELNDRIKNQINSINERGFHPEIISQATSISDYITVGRGGNITAIKDLSYTDLYRLSVDWHNSLNVGSDQLNYVEKNEIIIDFRDKNGVGFYWANLNTNYSEEECNRMGHCGRTGFGNILYSLREETPIQNSKYLLNKSKLTASIGNGTMFQLKGPKNSKPNDIFHKYIVPLFFYKNEHDEYLIEDFGSEYDSNRDFKLTDLPTETIKIVYDKRPELFKTRALKRILSELGLIEYTPPNLTFELNFDANEVSYYINAPRNFDEKILDKIICGDTYDFFGYNEYDYYVSFLEYNSLTSKNEEKIIEILKARVGDSFDPDLSILNLIQEFDVDYEIVDAINSACRFAEEEAYLEYYNKKLFNSLEEYGTVKQMDCDGVIIEINLDNFNIPEETLDEYLDEYNEDLLTIFKNLVSEGYIETPVYDYDERYTPYSSDETINKHLEHILSEINYQEVGVTEAIKKQLSIISNFKKL